MSIQSKKTIDKKVKATKKSVPAFEWKYAPAPESTDHIHIKPQYELFIGGKFVKPATSDYFETTNPANNKVLSSIAKAGASDVDKAVKAARKAYTQTWQKCRPVSGANTFTGLPV